MSREVRGSQIVGPDTTQSAGAFDVVVLVSSAGGLHALATILGELPADIQASVLVQQHLSGKPSLMPKILSRHTKLPVAWAVADATPERGHVAIVPPQQRMLVSRTFHFGLSPAIPHELLGDVLVGSLATAYGARCLLVVLTGMGDDGSAGARALHDSGGTVFAQDSYAEFPSMPQSAVDTGAVDRVVPLDEIAGAIVELVGRAA